ncbi:MAG: LysR family transcriptional regulator [Beijerinckiaceae bacterium]
MSENPGQRVAAEQGEIVEATRSISWDDLRLFLACADSGSLRRAGKRLAIDSSTVVRRIDRLETAIGQRLFNRLNAGVTLTDDGNLLAADVRAMERFSLDIVRRTKITDQRLHGLVRVAITEGLGTYWLMPKLIEFQYANRMLTFELICTTELMDVSRLQTDISIQFKRPSTPDMIVTRLGRLHVFPFAAESYQRLFGLPKSLHELRHHRLLQLVSPQVEESAFVEKLKLPDFEGAVGIRTNASSALLYAVERGAGIGLLPTYALALGARLVPVEIGITHFHDIWVTYHPDLKNSERHMVALRWLRRIFDPQRYPCFKDEFIHPVALIELMAETAAPVHGRGFIAVEPGFDDGALKMLPNHAE